MLVTSGLAHLLPIKVVTILSGAAGIKLGLFAVSCAVSRGIRFFTIAWHSQSTERPLAISSKNAWACLRGNVRSHLGPVFVIRYVP
jgi:hypothetical protein